MYRISFSRNAQNDIDLFIDSILQSNLKMFEDCGIDNVQYIEESYISHSLLLQNKILHTISSRGCSKILGNSIFQWEKYFVIQVSSFRIFVYYKVVCGITRKVHT